MIHEPLVIQQGNRKAIIKGSRVSLLHVRNKKKDEGVWPETDVPDGIERMNAAFLWVKNGAIDLPGVSSPRRYWQ